MARDRVISVGLSRLFRLLERDGPIYRIEQAVKDPLTKRWKWHPLATSPEWLEAHGGLHQMQADFLDKMIERQGSFRGDRNF